MAFFNLPFSVRISNNDPIDGDRYIASDLSARDALITNGRAHDGLQVFDASSKILYILKDLSSQTWEEVGSDASALADLQAYVDASLVSLEGRLDDLQLYVDGSLISLQSYIDGSLNSIDFRLNNIDSSIQILDLLTQSLDSSIQRIDNYNSIQDASIFALENASVSSWNGLTTSVDNSIGIGGILNQNTTINADEYSFTISSSDNNENWAYMPMFRYLYYSSYDAVEDSGIDNSFANSIGRPRIDYSVYNSNVSYELSISALDGIRFGKNGDDAFIFDSSIFEYTYNPGQWFTDRAIPDWGNVKSYVDGSISASGSSLDASISDLYSIKLNNTTDTFVGTLTLQGDLDLSGNLTVNGSTYIVGTETIDVSSGYIHLNTGLTGVPPTTMQSGIIIGRGSEDPYVILFDESEDTFRIGIASETSTGYLDSSTQAVATREDNPDNEYVPYWDASDNIFKTSLGGPFVNSTLIGATALFVGNQSSYGYIHNSQIGFNGNNLLLTDITPTNTVPNIQIRSSYSGTGIGGNAAQVSIISQSNEVFRAEETRALIRKPLTVESSIYFTGIMSDTSTNKVLFYNETTNEISYADASFGGGSGSGTGEQIFFTGTISPSASENITIFNNIDNLEFSEIKVFYRHDASIIYNSTSIVLPDTSIVDNQYTVQTGDPGDYTIEYNNDSSILSMIFTASSSVVGNGSLIVRGINFDKVN